jgi:hypothetical protein
MSKLHTPLLGFSLSAALIAGGLTFSAPANAVEQATTPESAESAYELLANITPAQAARAITEAEQAGAVTDHVTAANGTTTTTFDLGNGFVFDLVQPSAGQRIGVGTDSRGVFVSFNATDQNMIISGAAFGLGAGLCAVGGPAFCVITGAILTVATVAITGSGAIRCGTRALRVYPFTGGRVSPRCA